MSKSNYLENALLALIYNATAITSIARDAASPITNIKMALHSADPGEGGSQTTSALSYTGYAQKDVPRSGSGFTVSGNQVVNAAEIAFAICTAGSGTASYWSFGDGTNIFHSGAFTTPLVIGVGVIPTVAAGAISITED